MHVESAIDRTLWLGESRLIEHTQNSGQIIIAQRFVEEPFGLVLGARHTGSDTPRQTTVIIRETIAKSPNAGRILISAQRATLLRAREVQTGNTDVGDGHGTSSF